VFLMFDIINVNPFEQRMSTGKLSYTEDSLKETSVNIDNKLH